MKPLDDVDLVLASTSRYRRELLSRLTTKFRSIAPQVDERRLPDELPDDLVARLSEQKARAAALKCPGAVVIGSDQVAWEDDLGYLGKPGSAENARAQLASCSGRSVGFFTGVCVVDARGGALRRELAVDLTSVKFRALDAAEIARYVEREQPLDCAGSFKCEGLGISLFEHMETRDPTGLIGLPLLVLCRLLRKLGIAVP
jgi:septum formation protein